MRICGTLLGAGLALLAAGEAAAGPLQFLAHAPGSSSFFKVSADLTPAPPEITPSPPEIIPSPPSVDLSDPAHLLLTQQVQNEALFSFGMQGLNGENFSFTPSEDSLALFTATGTQGTTFKVFFNSFYTDDAGTHSPFHSALSPTPPEIIPGNPVIPGNPIFPAGSFSIDYTLQVQQDPPFTVGITILDAAGDNLTFTGVPEPGSLTIMAAGAAILAGGGWRRRRPRLGIRRMFVAASAR